MRLEIVFGFIVSVFAPHLFAQSYDSLVRHDLGAVEDLSPQVVVATPDGGHWISAQNPHARNDPYQLVHLDANGNRLAGAYFPYDLYYNQREAEESLYSLADQGLLEVRSAETSCTVRRLSPDGTIKFERRFFDRDCSIKISESELLFLMDNGYRVSLLAADGSEAAAFSPLGENVRLIDVEFTNAGRELLVLQTDPSLTGFELRRVDVNGQQLWIVPVQNARYDANRGNKYIGMHALRNGRAMVVFATETGLDIALYDASGQLLETQSFANSANSQFFDMYDWIADDLGNMALYLTFLRPDVGDRVTEFVVFSPDGNLLKRVRVTPGDACRDSCQIIALASGFVHLKTENVYTPQAKLKMVFVSPDPNVAAVERVLDFADAPILSRGKNSSILALSSDPDGVRTLRAFDANGSEIAAPSLLAKGITQPEVHETLIVEDGRSYIKHTVESEQGKQRLVAFAANGLKLWQKDVFYGGSMLANAARVCLTRLGDRLGDERITLICYRSDNGLEIVNTSVSVNLQFARYRARFLDDGRFRLVYADPNLKVLDVADDNLFTEFIAATSTFNIVDIAGNGSILFNVGNAPTKEWVVLQPSGEIAFRSAMPQGASATLGKLLPNNFALLVTRNLENDPFTVTLVDPNGTQAWSITTAPESFASSIAQVLVDANNVYIGYRYFGDSALGWPLMNLPMRVSALALDDGHLVWSKNFKHDQYSELGLFNADNSNELLVSVSHEFGTELNRLASATGAVLERRLLACDSASCSAEASALDRNNDIRTITVAQDPGHASIVLGRVAANSSKPAIALDQPGLSGAWYTSQISGQGFFLEYFPQSKLMFAPWFTFSSEFSETSGEAPNSNSVSNLRWYTLSGIAEPSAKIAKLEIRRNDSGVFDSTPITESTVVGTATLRAQNCNSATLEFEFFSSELISSEVGKYGVLPLDRLTGGSAPCQLSNGQVLPGRDARPAHGGFDGRQSGSWFQPQTAGQGLMMTVQPATVSAPGFFFGGWFTYDAGVPNDPTSQHWLTLSGEIPVNAQTGVVPVTIYRTLGGQLAAVPTQNNAILGQGTVTFSGCANAVLRYQFDDALIAGAFRARAGVINLERLGACPAQ